MATVTKENLKKDKEKKNRGLSNTRQNSRKESS
jgi:hypothetical protein